MNMRGYGGNGGTRTGGSVKLPTTKRLFHVFPDRNKTRSPFPPLAEGEGEKILTRKAKPPGSTLTADEQALAVRLKKQGLTYREVVAETGFSIGQVRGALRAHDVKAPAGTRRDAKFSQAQRAEIRRAYNDGGSTMRELANRYSTSTNTISKIVREGDR